MKKIYWFFAIIAIILQLLLPLMPFQFITRYTSDDFYYYLDVADHFASSGIPAANGVDTTNGWHPFYMFFLVLLFKLFPERILMAHVALLLLTVFHLLSTIFIYRILKLLCNERIASIAVLVWLWNPFTFFIIYQGVEVQIAGFFISALFYAYLKFKEDKSFKKLLLVSFLAGCAFLGRTDSALLIAIIGVDLIITQFRDLRSITCLFYPAVYGIIAFLIALPYLTWSFLNFSTIMQSSGVSLSHRAHLLITNTNSSVLMEIGRWILTWFYKFLNMFGAPVIMGAVFGLFVSFLIPFRLKHRNLLLGALAVLVAIGSLSFTNTAYYTTSMSRFALDIGFALAAGILGILVGMQYPTKSGFIKKNYLFLAYLLVIVAFYAGTFWHFQIWYIYTPFLVMMILLPQLAYYKPDLFRKSVVAFLIILFVFIVLSRAYAFSTRGDTRDIAEQRECWDHYTDITFGSFDSGRRTYLFIPTLVNLDGVVNNDVANAIIDNKLLEYLDERGVQVILTKAPRVREYSIMFQQDLFEIWEKTNYCGQEAYIVNLDN